MELTRMIKAPVRQAYAAYTTRILRREKGLVFSSEINENALAYATALRFLTQHGAREVVDVGPGLACWPRLLADCAFRVTAMDSYSRENYWGYVPFNRHYLVERDDITQPQLNSRFDALTCLNVMGAVTNDTAAIAGMFRLVRPGGLIVLSFPYNEHRSVANVYKLPGAGWGQTALYPCRVYSRTDIERWLTERTRVCLYQERYFAFTGELWTMGRRVNPRTAAADEPHHFTTLILRKHPDA